MKRMMLSAGVVIGCLLATSAAHAEVTLKKTDDGGVKVTAPGYEATVGPNGCLQSLTTGGVELLKAPEPWKLASFMTDFVQGGCVGVVQPNITARKTKIIDVRAKKGQVVAGDDTCGIAYTFRMADFEVKTRSSKGAHGYLVFFPSEHVTASLDMLTDRAVAMDTGEPIYVGQEGMRWTTRKGPVLEVRERVDGYACCIWWGGKKAKPKRMVSLSAANRDIKYTFRPIAEPHGAEALRFTIDGENGFLLPGGKPVHFDIQATNVGGQAVEAEVEFQVRDFRTRQPVLGVTTAVKLDAKASVPVKTDIPLTEPGPYRGAIVVRAGDKALRELDWIFAFDFAGYKPELTREPDFKAFWKATLDELAAVPMDAKMTLNEEQSTSKVAVYEVSLATLNGERVWGWYSRPKKEGKYPVHYFCPPTGVYPMNFWSGKGDGTHCTFNIAIHGFDLHLSDMPKGADPRKSYHTAGLASRETSRWRQIYANLVRAMDFLCSRPEVDAKRIAVSGSSQGGGLAIVLAGLDPRVAFLHPTCSGLCRLDWTIKHKVCYWPFTAAQKPKGQSMDEFLKTISYFDAANFAPDIQCPAVAHVQLLDWVTTSGGQLSALAHLKPGQVEVIADPWVGHGGASWPCRTRFRKSMSLFLAGKPPVVKPSK